MGRLLHTLEFFESADSVKLEVEALMHHSKLSRPALSTKLSMLARPINLKSRENMLGRYRANARWEGLGEVERQAHLQLQLQLQLHHPSPTSIE